MHRLVAESLQQEGRVSAMGEGETQQLHGAGDGRSCGRVHTPKALDPKLAKVGGMSGPE